MTVFGIAFAAPGVFTTTTQDGRIVTITIINDDIIKVSNTSAEEEVPVSRSVILAPTDFAGEAMAVGGKQIVTTATGVVATLDNATGAVTITSGENRAIADNGERTFVDGKRAMSLSTMGVGSFYGAGERGFSYNLSGDTLVMYNKQNYGYKKGESRIKQMNITMPLFISSNGYAVLFDDFSAAEMIMENPVKYVTESRQPVSYYFINGGGTLAGVVERFTELTGRQELPPFWAMGYITSKYGYKTATETEGVIDTLKLNDYPVDGVVLDLYWYGKEEDMGRLAWEPEQWQDHKAMLARLKDRGVNTVIISQPYVLKNGKAIDNYNELSPRGMFCRDSVGNTHDVTIWVGTGGMFDVSNPDTREWLRNRYKLLTDEGVGGWWGDLGEPEVHPETIYHYNGLTAREYHNLYGNEWSRIIYDLYKEEYPETRLMTLMRGGTAGLQRYSVFPWSTDVSRSWGGLQPQVTIMMNSGLSGLGYMSHDVGGFAITEDKVVDPELYVRWLQLGTFSPILRTHAQQVAEPYRYTEQQDIILDLIKTRYRWLPYNYTLAYENASQGLPMVRPLNFYSQSSTQYDDIEDQYFWGSDVMIAPVLEQGAVARRVVIPDGQWIDYNNPSKIYNGGDTISYDAPLGVLPMFVKAGALIPQADYAMGNTGDYRVDNYTIKYFPVEGVGSEYTLFEDDCKSATSLEKDEYSLITFSGLETSESYEIKVSNEGTYTGAPTQKQLTFVIYNVDSKPRQVVVDGKKLRGKAVKYNAEASTLTITFDWTVSANTSLLVVK
jgi:alpha-glucosidase (family GH31 glycosyl hydrolase)